MATQKNNGDSLGLVYKQGHNGTSNTTTQNLLFFGDFEEIRQPVYGYFFPAVAAVTILTNIILCIVLIKMKTKSPVNMLLVSISIFDLITVLVSQPMLLFYFTFDNVDWVPYDWCLTFKLTLMYIPSTAHMTSLWLTVFMAAQRYFIVRKPFLSYLVTPRKTLVLIALAFFIGLSVNFLRLFDSHYIPVAVPSKKNPDVVMTGCVEVTEPWITDPSTYFSMYHIFRATFQSYIPSIVLLVLNALLIYEMRKALKNRKSFNFSTTTPQERAKESANIRTTMMLVAVVAVTISSEIPTAIAFSVIILSAQLGVQILDPYNMGIAVLVVDVLLLISYPMNCVLYYFISSNFRSSFREIFCPCATLSSSDSTSKIDSSATSEMEISQNCTSETDTVRKY